MARTSISLQIPADTSFVGLVRTATLGFASRLDFPIDQLDELSHAAHEMTTLLLADTGEGGLIDLQITELNTETVQVEASSQTNRGLVPRTNSFAWTIINALVDSVDATAIDGIVTITAVRSIQPYEPDSGAPNNVAPDGRTEAAL